MTEKNETTPIEFGSKYKLKDGKVVTPYRADPNDYGAVEVEGFIVLSYGEAKLRGGLHPGTTSIFFSDNATSTYIVQTVSEVWFLANAERAEEEVPPKPAWKSKVGSPIDFGEIFKSTEKINPFLRPLSTTTYVRPTHTAAAVAGTLTSFGT